MDEQTVIDTKGARYSKEWATNALPSSEIAPTAGSSRLSAISGADSNARALGRDIKLKRRVIRKLEKNERAALRDIAKRGAAVIDPRCDSNGRAVDKLVPNPNLRVVRECRAAITALRKEIVQLESALAETTAPPKEMSTLETLAARAGRLRE